MMPVHALVEDLSIYPRSSISTVNVRNLIVALQAGCVLPVPIVDRRSKRVVDGFHRRRAFLAVLGPDAEVEVELRTYKSEAALLAAATQLNTAHGLPLAEIDKRRVVLRLSAAGLSDDEIAVTLHATPVRVKQLSVKVVTVVNERGLPIRIEPLKRPVFWMQGGEMTEAQAKAHSSAPGTSYLLLVRQLEDALKYRLLPTTGPMTAALETLKHRIGDYLEGGEDIPAAI
jgi:hypothetical protein